MPFTEKEFDEHYDPEVYHEQADLFEENREDWNKKYTAWVKTHKTALIQIYVNRVMDMENEACKNSIRDWTHNVFIRYTANKRMEEQVARELKEMLGE